MYGVNDGPRTWKWLVPGALFILSIPLTGKMYVSTDAEIQFWAMLPCGFGSLFLIVTLVNLWKVITYHNSIVFTAHQEALAMTPLVLLSQSMKQMHPEAVKVLNRFGVRTNWEVRVNQNLGQRDWTLQGTNVHFGFIEYVLSRSGKALYPKGRFSEGSKKWDPDGLIEDRIQHEEFESWLFARLMVTRSHGEYKPAEFIQPWTPELILETLGMTGEQELFHPDEEVKYKNLNGSGRTPLPSASPQMSATSSGNLGGEGAKPQPLSPEALAEFAAENAAYADLNKS